MAEWYDVVIVGGGFGGAYCARQLEQLLRHRSERVLLVAPENFVLFSPLLPEAASGTLEPRHAVIPLRELLHRTHVLAGQVASLDIEGRHLVVADLNGDSHQVGFRSVVLSPGSLPSGCATASCTSWRRPRRRPTATSGGPC
jgi:NADH dehydrogenase